MITFLSIACKQKFVLDSYEDEAVGHMEKNADGKLAITRVELRPKITWSGKRRPSVEELDKMHHAAHENCFTANSVKTNVTVAERLQPSQAAPRHAHESILDAELNDFGVQLAMLDGHAADG